MSAEADLESFLVGHRRVSAPRFAECDVVGDWRIVAFIARGGTAEVYRAARVSDGQVAALKVLHKNDEVHRQRLAREAEFLRTHRHTAFPVLLDSRIGEDGPSYLVEEFLYPLELPRKDRAVAQLMLKLCAAVGYLHCCGLVHRDLKPSNIMTRREGGTDPVIVDFGLLRAGASAAVPRADSLTIENGRPVGVGTPGYGAPEQFIGGEVSPSVDIHALGVLAQKLMPAGARGFGAAAWRRIIWRATSSIPSERYQTVEAFARAVRRRHWLKYIVTAVCAFVAMSLLGWWAYDVFGPKFPTELKLAGRSVVRSDFIRLEPGKTYRIVGPGLLDAHITGPDSSRLWLTNCALLNRADKTFPDVGLEYELAGGVFLDLVNAAPPADGDEIARHVKGLDGNRNSIRFGPPNTLRELMRALNLEDADDE